MLTVDTLKAYQDLKAAELTDAQAQAIVGVIKTAQEAWLEKLANKEDLRATREDLRSEIEILRNEMKGDIALLRNEMKGDIALLRSEMKELEVRLKHDLTLRLGGMLAAGIAIVAALVKLF